MKRLQRSFWLAACGCWACLGYGLYRELPREMAPSICDLRLRGMERMIGFVGDGDLVLTETTLRDDRSRFAVWEVAGPNKLFECEPPPGWNVKRVAPFHAIAFGQSAGGVEALDLLTGAQTRLASASEVVGVHPTRPWVALALKGPDDTAPGRSFPRSTLLVIDFRTGARILEWSDPHANANGPRIRDCQFDGADGLYLFSDHHIGDALTTFSWDVVRLSFSQGGTARLQLSPAHQIVPPVSGGRVLVFGGDGDNLGAQVLEFPTGRRVFSSADHQRTDDRAEWKSPPRLSADGRSLYTGSGTLWTIADGRRLWPPKPAEPPGGWSMSDSFVVYEDWGHWLDRFFRPAGFTTVAVRDFAGASLRYRFRGGVDLACFSDNGRRGATSEGVIYALPPRVNWLLFALCQALLALPLLLLHLRFRRRRTAP